MMTRSEVVDLLALIARYDQRTVGTSDVDAWYAVARVAGWRYPLAQRAVVDHHADGADKGRIRPAHITDTIKQARETIRRTILRRDLAPPRELADDPRAEIEWKRNTVTSATEEALKAWANYGPLPQIEPDRPQIGTGVPQRIRDLIEDAGKMPAVEKREPADANDRARKVEQARRELANVQPADPPDTEPIGAEP